MQRQPIGLHFMPEGEDPAQSMLERIPMSVVKFYLDRGYLDDPRKMELIKLAGASGALVVGRRYADPMPDQAASPEAEAERYFNGSQGVESFVALAGVFTEVQVWEGPNEVICKTPAEMQWYAAFCVKLADLMLTQTKKLAVLGNWATGNPELELWADWVPVLQLAQAGKCILSRHSYGAIEGDPGTWHGLRHRRDMAKWAELGFVNLPLILTECGADLDGGYPGAFHDAFGKEAEAIYPYHDLYLKPLAEELAKDRPAVLGAVLFTTGNGMGPWDRFDTAHTPWADAIEKNPPKLVDALTPPAPTVSTDWPAWATHVLTGDVNVRQFPYIGALIPPLQGNFLKGKYIQSLGTVTKPSGAVMHLVGPDGNMWIPGAFLQAKPVTTVLPIPATPPVTNTSRGIVGRSFSVEQMSVPAGQPLWFNFKVENTTNQVVDYSILAARTEQGPAARSWTNEKLQPGQVLEWRDHINFPQPGAYKIYLGIGYDGDNANYPWDRLSPSITVSVTP